MTLNRPVVLTAVATVLGALAVAPGAAQPGPEDRATCRAFERLVAQPELRRLDRAMNGPLPARAFRRAQPVVARWFDRNRAVLPQSQRRAVRRILVAGDSGRLTVSRIETLLAPVGEFVFTRCGITP